MSTTTPLTRTQQPPFSTYNDKVPSPDMSRVDIAFSKYLILGQFSEIQMISPGNEYRKPGVTMYHVFTSPNLKHCTTVTIERKNSRNAWVTLKVNRSPEFEPTGSDAQKTKAVWAKTDNLTFQIRVSGLMGDAEIILEAFKQHGEIVTMHVNSIFGMSL